MLSSMLESADYMPSEGEWVRMRLLSALDRCLEDGGAESNAGSQFQVAVCQLDNKYQVFQRQGGG